MKVLVVSSQLIETPPIDYGGLEYVCALHCKYLLERGYEVGLVCLKGSHISWHLRFGELMPKFYESYSRDEKKVFEKFLRQNNLKSYDFILDHSWYGYFSEYAVKHDIPHIKFCHGLIPPRVRELYEKGVNLFTVSKFHSEFLSDYLMAKEDLPYLYNCIDVSEYESSSEKEDYVVHLGRIEFGKGVSSFIRFCEKYKVKGYVIGEDRFVKDTKYVEDIIRKSTNFKYVKYVGRVPHDIKVELLKKAKVLLLCYRENYQEVFGIALVEGLVCGTPVVARDNGAVREIINSPKIGSVFKSNNEIYELINKKYDYNTCRERGLEFDYKKICRELEEFILEYC